MIYMVQMIFIVGMMGEMQILMGTLHGTQILILDNQ